MREYIDTALAYTATLLGAVVSHLTLHEVYSCAMAVGSLLLLVVRLVVDVPKALAALRRWRKGR